MVGPPRLPACFPKRRGGESERRGSRHASRKRSSCFSTCALRAGEGEMLWACGPSDLPFQPLGAPRWLSHLLGPRFGPVSFLEKLTVPQAARQSPSRSSFGLNTP